MSNVSKVWPQATAQLKWLEWVLYLSRAKNEKVWLIFHEPMGINMYPALHGKNAHCADNVETFMKQAYRYTLRCILSEASDLIEAAFCGHTHMDEFQILHDGKDTPLMVMHATPSVSPVFGNNPAYSMINTENRKAFYDCIWDTTREAFIEDYCPFHQSSLWDRKRVSGND